MVISSRDEARASLARAEAAVANTKVELARTEQLAPSGTISKSSLDSKRVAYEQAFQDAAKAKATLSRYSSSVLDEQADVFVALRGIESAEAELDKALAELDKAYVRAPIAGTVLTVHVRPGEKPGTSGIVDLGNIDEMTAEIEVYQTLIGRVSVGAPVTITADALPGPLEGTVTRLGLQVARQTSTDATPAANTDARIVKVYVQLSPASIAVAQRYTNLQVTARIAARAP
jgi:HlyD family secretion protein